MASAGDVDTATRISDPLEIVRSLKAEVAGRSREIEQGRRLPADLARRMGDAGLFRAYLPRTCGGDERTPPEVTRLYFEMAQADASVAWCLMIGVHTGLIAGWLAPGPMREVFRDPNIVTAGGVAPTGTAVPDGDDYVVTGRWAWASGGENAAWFSGGVLIEGPDGTKQYRLAFMPAKDVELIDTWHAAGLCGTGSLDFAARDVRVPAALVVPVIGAPAREPGPLYQIPPIGLFGAGQAYVSLGNAAGALAAFERVVTKKRPQDFNRAPAERSTIQAEFALAQAKLGSARAFLDEAIETTWQLALRGDPFSLEDRARIRLAASYGSRIGQEVARTCYDLAGGAAVYLDSELQRRHRDACIMPHHRTVGPQSFELAGAILLGQETDITML